MAEWKVEDTPYMNSATLRDKSTVISVDADADGITVDAECGSGYLREHITTFIPMAVLTALLEKAGYTVGVAGLSEGPDT